jgi:hypothetical protein
MVRTAIVIGAADCDDTLQGYPWRWDVLCAAAHRSGACDTREQAEYEAEIVLALLSAR